MHSPEFIAKKGLNALFKNKGRVVPGIIKQLGLNVLKYIPDSIIRNNI